MGAHFVTQYLNKIKKKRMNIMIMNIISIFTISATAKCLGNGLTIKCEGAIVDLDLTDEQLSKIADILK